MNKAVPAKGKVTLGIRPQHVKLAANDMGTVPAEVTLVEALGSETVVHTMAAGNQPLLLTLEGQHKVTAGEKVHLKFDDARLHLFDIEGLRLN